MHICAITYVKCHSSTTSNSSTHKRTAPFCPPFIPLLLCPPTQRHAAKGHHTTALDSIFSSDAGSSDGSNGDGAASLSTHMEVVDAVLRLAADASSSNEALR